MTMDQVEVAKVAVLRRRGRRRHLADRGDPRPQGPRGGPLGPLRRPRTPPDRRARRDGGGRDQGGRRPRSDRLSQEFAEKLAAIEAEIYEEAGPRVQHRLAPAAPAGPLRRAEAPVARRRRPRASRAPTSRSWRSWPASTRCRACSSSIASFAKLKSTYLDALAVAGRPGRPGPRLVQPGRRRHGPAQLQRPEPPEHPDPDRGRRPDPPGVRGRDSPAGRSLTADYSQIELRILAHYSKDPALVRAFARGPRHPHGRRRADLQRPRGGGGLVQAAGGQDGQLRRDLRPQPVRPGRAAGDLAGRGRGVHRGLFQRIRRGRCVHHADARIGARHGTGRDDPRPPPADQRDQEHDRARPQPRRADGGQHGHPGLGRRPDQARDARRRPPDPRARGCRPGCSSRSTTSWSSRRRTPRSHDSPAWSARR